MLIVNNIIFVQDRALPYWHLEVTGYSDKHLPRRRIWCVGEKNLAFQPWPPRSLNQMFCDYFLSGYVQDRVFIPPLPVDIDDLKR